MTHAVRPALGHAASALPSSPWLAHSRPTPDARCRLFCLPYAGGTAAAYKTWQDSLPGVHVCPLELPGRGARFGGPLVGDLLALVDEMAAALLPLTAIPFALFGHSMGAVLAFELARTLTAWGRSPRVTICAGRHAPHRASPVAPIHHLPDSALIEELQRLGGTPPEILAEPDLLEMFLPIIRADFAAHETYRYREGPPLHSPLHVLGAKDDTEAPPDCLSSWRDLTIAPIDITLFDGDHFFVQKRTKVVVDAIRRILHQYDRSDCGR